MKKRKISIFLSATILTLCINSISAKAFQPVSHCILIESVANSLPKNSLISQSIKKYPQIANWGANAPDLGYLQPGQVLERAPWADRYHYYKVGSFAKEQLKEALKSKDMKKISFAAGWVSHITGDLNCHGKFVNPECGVYMANENSRPLHKKLENSAEAFIFSNAIENTTESFNAKTISSKFDNYDEIPFDMVNKISQQVYGQSPSENEERLWCKTLLIGLKTGVGYTYGNLNDSKSFLSKNNRKERLEEAFKCAKDDCVKILSEAEKGNYSSFTDRWNLDVGASNSPISSLTITVETGKNVGAGTDDDVYLCFKLKDGNIKEWKLDKKNYNDFECGDYDEYYLYINDINIHPEDIVKTYIDKRDTSSISSDWYLKEVKLDINGIDAVNKTVDKWINKKNTNEELKINWNNI